ncbi:MAG: hypothetical protein FWD19_05365 [Defluviitaleaceae bacterium]|nr:hypothetical protein [Defluviitaleaceae bacterium]
MTKLLTDDKYNFVGKKDTDFIVAFDDYMIANGYKNNGIQAYYVFGKYKIEYYKTKNKYVARIYFRDDGIVLRLYFSNIEKHKNYIENAPEFIKKPFVDDSHKCKKPNCKGMMLNDKCRFRKTYTIDGMSHVKCASESFMYHELEAENASEYVALLDTFYPGR